LGALVATPVAWAGANRIDGRTHVLDGETIVVDGWRVRLKGVVAPELGTPAVGHSREVMRDVVGPAAIGVDNAPMIDAVEQATLDACARLEARGHKPDREERYRAASRRPSLSMGFRPWA
jgi:hypothetical protein